ncbi:MAG: substrate-binding domain-containing protein [Phycisphaerales bacterium]
MRSSGEGVGGLSRRQVLKASLGAAAGVALVGCRSGRAAPVEPVTLYTSADAFLVQQVTAAFTATSGIAVRAVTDSEATKTAGLVERLVAERGSPRAEVWWSSEVMGTVSLARAGLLTRSAPACLSEEFSGSWPGGVCDSTGLWWGFGQRARVVVWSTKRVEGAKVPRSLEDLASFTPAGRVGIAQPQFGTTRTHLAWTVASIGEERAGALFARLKEGCRLYPGNSAVVRAVAQGECDVGLTDTDDVWAGRANGWAVDAAFGVGAEPGSPLLVPNTAALVARPVVRAEARSLLDFLVSAPCERILAQSESRNVPIRHGLTEELLKSLPELSLPDEVRRANPVDWNAVGNSLERADALIAARFPV